MRYFFWLIAPLCLIGCMPKHEHPAIPMKDVEMPEGADGEWPDEMWWNMFNDPQLARLIEQGLEASPTLKKALARTEIAHQLTRSKRSSLFPSVDGDAQYNRQYLAREGLYRAFAPQFPGWITQIDVALNFTYEIDFWGRNIKGFQAALGRERAARAEAAQSALILAVSIAQTYFQLQADQAKKEVLEETLHAQEEVAGLSSAQMNHGIVPKQVPLIQAESVETLRKAVFEIEKMIQLDIHKLLALIGKGQGASLDLEPMPLFENVSFQLPKNISADLLARRPDLMAQIWRVEAAAKEIGVARTSFYPNVNLSGFLGYESLYWNSIFDWKDRMVSFLPAIHLPIFEGGRLRAALSGAYATYDEAVDTYNEMVLNSAKEVVDELSTLTSVDEQLVAQSSILNDVSTRYELERSRFDHGVADLLTVLAIQQEWLGARVAEIDLLYFRQIANLNLIRSLGGGYDARG